MSNFRGCLRLCLWVLFVGAPVGVHFLWKHEDVSAGYVGWGTLGLMVVLTVFLLTVVGTAAVVLVSKESLDRELAFAVGVVIYSGWLVLWIWSSFFIRLMSF